MKLNELLSEQFTASYDENGWFVALKNAIAGLTAGQSVWRPEGIDNSIWEIISHLDYYNNAYLRRFKGESVENDIESNDETFSAGDVTEESWRQAVQQFGATMAEWRAMLNAADDAKLNEPAPPRNEWPWLDVISNMIVHNAHHGGQIVVIRKLQGSWDREKGVS
ncbi:MAG: DinB family protein [Acidobacteriota bacterium]